MSGLATPAQADVEATFQVMDLDKAEPFDPAWRGADAQAVCAARGADARGGVGPFGLWVLASDELKERTAVFFSVFKRDDADVARVGGGKKHVVLTCNDPSRSSYAEQLYKPTYAGFVDVDIAPTGKISLRTLVINLFLSLIHQCNWKSDFILEGPSFRAYHQNSYKFFLKKIGNIN